MAIFFHEMIKIAQQFKHLMRISQPAKAQKKCNAALSSNTFRTPDLWYYNSGIQLCWLVILHHKFNLFHLLY